MTREEAIESGIRQAWRFLGATEVGDDPLYAAEVAIMTRYPERASPDELEGFAVGLQLVAVEVAEIARKRRDATAGEVVT